MSNTLSKLARNVLKGKFIQKKIFDTTLIVLSKNNQVVKKREKQ